MAAGARRGAPRLPEEQNQWEIHLRPKPESFSLPSDEDEEGEK